MSVFGEAHAAKVRMSEADPDASYDRGLRATLESDVAFRRWYERCAPRVYAYLIARCSSAVLAEELTQAVFVEAVRHPDTFDGRADPVPWLCGIARHRLARHYGQEARIRQWSTTAAVRPIGAGAQDAAWHAADLRGRIHFALDATPALQRAALILRYMDDLPVRDVARHLHRSEAATESLLRRARERFEREFRGTDDAD